ncbi:MAG TPA: carbohydrate kinase [Chitinophagaceae bacterium]|nr:carbohydrate kinase [Chitinophagaceae bacterium]
MLLLGIDVGTSSVKVSVVDAATHQCVASAHYPETEAEIIAPHAGWAEQSPDQWWEYVKQAILKCNAAGNYDPQDISAIGIAYQMHGLVLVDKDGHVLRNAIIWCDSRAVETGNKAFEEMGREYCLRQLLNSPGNFTASKLAWVKENEPAVYEKINKIMLPGDFIAFKMTGDITTTNSALSEGIFWDFRKEGLSSDIMRYFGFDESLIPAIQPLFSSHGYLKASVASRLSLKQGIPVAYKAGDQPNNALSLNVMEPGEVAATAGTSGVIYGVSDELGYDAYSRINSFAHVNHSEALRRIGILLCINGTGIFNRWIRTVTGAAQSYATLNEAAASVPVGAEGLLAIPFGNGAERMLNNQIIGAHFEQIDLNKHGIAHMVRAVQEGIAFSFRYGLDIMRENGMNPQVVRASSANLFLSDVFTKAFAGVNQVSVEFYEGDGSYGAAIGAGIGSGVFANTTEAAAGRKSVAKVAPSHSTLYEERYSAWKESLETRIAQLKQHEIVQVN